MEQARASRTGFRVDGVQASREDRVRESINCAFDEVSVGADDLNAVSTWEDRDVETGVRLKSAFKF